jgi:PEP-CTERM motif-containing protein
MPNPPRRLANNEEVLVSLKVFGLKFASVALLAMGIVQGATQASAGILVDQLSPYGGHYVGGSDMGLFTSALASQPGGYTIGSVANASAVASASAILIVARDNNFGTNTSFSATEIANLTSFMSTGGRVVIIGEGAMWSQWNNSVLAFASGGTATSTGATISGPTAPVVSNALTAGVGTISLQGAGISTGGTALFDQNFATLWGSNLLTVLDFQVFQDFGAPAFRDNIAEWLGESTVTPAVPEASTWAMMILGFAGIGVITYRRRNGAALAA